MSGRGWDAATYHRVSGPLAALGAEVLERLPLRGDETVLDAGCGTGRVTLALCERLPRGRVLAVDSSPAMVAEARRTLAGRADVRLADLVELELDEPVDAIVSTATFHWILDHDRLFARLAAALRPGGRLAAQCGGSGNLAAVLGAAGAVGGREPYAPHLQGFVRPTLYAGAEESEARLRAAGFAEARCWLRAAPQVLPDEPLAYLATIPLGPQLQRLPVELRPGFVEAVAARLGDPVTVDYVRLELDAVR